MLQERSIIVLQSRCKSNILLLRLALTTARAYFRGVFSAMAKHESDTIGSMMAVGSAPEVVAPLIRDTNSKGIGRINIGCINSPESVTISGDEQAIDDLYNVLSQQGVFTRKLKVETAYHSHHMKKVSSRYLNSLRNVTASPLREGIQFFSSVTGDIKTSGFEAAYWVENLTSQVRFSDALMAFADVESTKAANVLIEIGPHSALQGPTRQTLSTVPNYRFDYFPTLLRSKDASRTVLGTIGSLFQLGLRVDLKAILSMYGSAPRYHTLHDLAPYPFDHGTKYWRESRLSRDHRLRQFPYHDLLGVLDVGCNILEPRWRLHLSAAAMPWLKHHVVDDMVIFPGTGYLCMAIEGMKQLALIRDPTASVSKYAIRNASFIKPIIIPSERSDGFPSEVEVQLVVSPSKVSHDDPWHTFHVYSYSDESRSWSEHCSGIVRAYLATNSSEVDEVEGTRGAELSDFDAQEKLEKIMSASHQQIDPGDLYSSMRASGNDYGPTFSSIKEIRTGKLEGYATHVVPDIPRYMPSSFHQPHVIHPATFDTFAHVLCLLYKQGVKNSTLMLGSIEEAVIYSEIPNEPGTELQVAIELNPESKQSGTGNCWTYHRDRVTDKLSLVATITNVQVRSTGDEIDAPKDLPSHRKNYLLSWQEDADHMTDASFKTLMESVPIRHYGDVSIPEQSKLNEAATAIISYRFLSSSNTRLRSELPSHLHTYHEWMNGYLASDRCSKLLAQFPSEAARDAILDETARVGLEGRMLVRIGQHLPGIFAGAVEPLDVMVKDDLLNQIYADGIISTCNPRMAKYLGALAFKKPHMRIIEVGAGTGGVTSFLLNALDKDGATLIDRFHYTDISTGFFSQAKVKFGQWRSCIDFKALDITKDPEEQGFESHSYDLLIASNVLHATPDISKTLQHIHKLLKPGGRMLLLELTGKTASIQAIFGILPG